MSTLKESVSEVHKLAEQTDWAKLLITGKIDHEQYAAHLVNLLSIHTLLEQRIKLPSDLLRSEKILEDLSDLKITADVLDITNDYVEYLSKLTDSELMSHIYVHYLGSLYGGQYIKKVLAFSSNHLEFNNSEDCIRYIRELTHDCDHNEAIRAFSWTISVYKKLWEEYK